MRNEKIGSPVRNGFIALLLSLALCLPSLCESLGAQETRTLMPPVGAGQRDESSRLRSLSFEDRGDIFMARKSYEDAVNSYSRALKESKFADSIVWNKLGIAYQQLENFNASRKAYTQSIHHRKNYSEPLNNMGTTFFMQKKYGKSVKYYEKAIKLSPESASYHLNLGTSFLHMKKYSESVEEYRTALSLDPNVFGQRSPFGTTIEARGADAEYYFYLGKVFASLGRVDEAVRSLRRALEDGFKDRKRILDDPDFLKISQNPAYVDLMNHPPVGIKD